MPISRVRSITAASMMLARPTPPMPRVSVPTKPSRIFTARDMPSMIDMNWLNARMKMAFSSVGEKRCSVARVARTLRMASFLAIPLTGVQTM